jgi:hypothetical protein
MVIVQNCINDKSQTILLDENAQVINQINRDRYNVTLLSRDKIAFLSYRGIEVYQR